MLDIIIVIILLAGIVLGYMRGFMSQIGGFIGILLGILCCRLFGGPLADKFAAEGDSIGSLLLGQIMAYAIILIVCYIIGRVLGKLLSGTLNVLHLGAVNRIGGAIFTPLEYLFALSVLLNLWLGVFPDTTLRSNYEGATGFVIDFAPKVLGSKTAQNIINAADRLNPQNSSELEQSPEE